MRVKLLILALLCFLGAVGKLNAQGKDSCVVDKECKVQQEQMIIQEPLTLADSLVACGNYRRLEKELHRLHELNRVMYGRMDMILDTKPCYIVVFDYRGDIVAFLEPGEESRVDLKSKKQLLLDDYAYYLKLWLIVY